MGALKLDMALGALNMENKPGRICTKMHKLNLCKQIADVSNIGT
jgi:hypothetical protein